MQQYNPFSCFRVLFELLSFDSMLNVAVVILSIISKLAKEVFRQHGFTNLIALQLITSEFFQQFDLAVCFDALCNAAHIQIVAQVYKMSDDKLFTLVVFRFIDQTFINFCNADLREVEHF